MWMRWSLWPTVRRMCDLYSITTNQEAIRSLFVVLCDLTENLPPLPAVYPVRTSEGSSASSDGWAIAREQARRS